MGDGGVEITFEVPESLELTSLSDAKPCDEIHMEAERGGRWIERLSR